MTKIVQQVNNGTTRAELLDVGGAHSATIVISHSCLAMRNAWNASSNAKDGELWLPLEISCWRKKATRTSLTQPITTQLGRQTMQAKAYGSVPYIVAARIARATRLSIVTPAVALTAATIEHGEHTAMQNTCQSIWHLACKSVGMGILLTRAPSPMLALVVQEWDATGHGIKRGNEAAIASPQTPNGGDTQTKTHDRIPDATQAVAINSSEDMTR